MLKLLKDVLSANVFPAICYLLAAYFLFAFCQTTGVPPSKALDATSGGYLVLALFLFMLPEAKKLKLGTLLEYEAKVQEIKEEVKQFKEETRNTLSAYTSLISAISNTVSQTINVNLPSPAEATQAKEALDETLKKESSRSELEDEIEHFLAQGGNDLNYALAKLRMQLERELRRVLGKRTETLSPSDGIKYQSAGALFREFTQKYPTYYQIGSSFDYVLKVCNAAIHGQVIPEGYAHEALYMGLRMLNELKTIEHK